MSKLLVYPPSALMALAGEYETFGYDLMPLVLGWLATIPNWLDETAQMHCGPGPEPQTSL
jgi:hypothetical protein